MTDEQMESLFRMATSGALTPTGADKTWVFTPEDCICEPGPPDGITTTHAMACPFFDDKVLAIVTVEMSD